MAAGEAGREPETHSSTRVCRVRVCVVRTYIYFIDISRSQSPERLRTPRSAPARSGGPRPPRPSQPPAGSGSARHKKLSAISTDGNGSDNAQKTKHKQKKVLLNIFRHAPARPATWRGNGREIRPRPRPRRKTRPATEGTLCRPEAERHMRQHLGLGNLTEVLRLRDASCPLFVERSPSRSSQRR